MSNSVARNSLIMASGTAASRVTGQIRTILLAAALGTTGIAANAYQAGAMIPQVLFTLVSGGIFNAVLVPQIVRTLEQKDAQERLNKLITVAIAMLVGITVLMALATPLLTKIYVNGGPQMQALTNAFTLWCMPQILFYGIYTVVGQILAAKGMFGAYAWSSVGANVISSAGFIAFIALFGKANEQPLSFWTPTTLALTAGTWTLGVAFQALVLFIPLARAGIRYRPKWGLRGIGLSAMGPVAAWSVGIVIITQLAYIVITRITSSAPEQASLRQGIDVTQVAGNATYQNAYTMYMLPYSLIAVSVATAIFPLISKALAAGRLVQARSQLIESLRNVSMLMHFFTAAFIVFPLPITLVLLPSVSVHEGQLISQAMLTLGLSLPMTSLFLIIQRTFYAFEDGKSPFIANCIELSLQTLILLTVPYVVPAQYWVLSVGVAITIGNMVAFVPMLIMLRKRFGGHLHGRKIADIVLKSLIAVAFTVVIGEVTKPAIFALCGVQSTPAGPAMNWGQAFVICVLFTIEISIVYFGTLWLLRVPELTQLIVSVLRKIGLAKEKAGNLTETIIENAADNESNNSAPNLNAISTEAAQNNLVSPTRKRSMSNVAGEFIPSPAISGDATLMTPQLGDTLANRYVLIATLRDTAQLAAWYVYDVFLDRDCQLIAVKDSAGRGLLRTINDQASILASHKQLPVTPVHQVRVQDGVLLLVSSLDEGLSVRSFLERYTSKPPSVEITRTIIGYTARAMQDLLREGVVHHALGVDTLRLTNHGVQIANTAVSALLRNPLLPSDPSHLHHANSLEYIDPLQYEPRIVQFLAGILHALLVGDADAAHKSLQEAPLPDSTPEELRIIVTRGLHEPGSNVAALETLDELIMLLGTWHPYTWQVAPHARLRTEYAVASISQAPLNSDDVAAINEVDVAQENTAPSIELPESLLSAGHVDTLSAERFAQSQAQASNVIANIWRKSKSMLQEGLVIASQGISDDDSQEFEVFTPNTPTMPSNTSTQPMDVAALRHLSRVSVEGVSGEEASERTSQMPLLDSDGNEVEAGSPSLRALAQEREAIEAEYRRQEAAQAQASWLPQPAPPSFAPQQHKRTIKRDTEPNVPSAVADEKLFGGKVSAKWLAISLVAIVLAVALTLAVVSLTRPENSSGIDTSSSGPWPELDLDAVPFGDEPAGTSTDSSQSSKEESKATSDTSEKSSDKKESDTKTSEGEKSDTKKKPTKKSTEKLVTADRQVKAVPAPKPRNTTPLPIASQRFIESPAGQSGFGYAVHLQQSSEVYKMIITIRTSGGQGYLRVNTTADPNAGQQVAQFAFAEGGTTEVTFDKPVTTQDILLWVPMDSLPQNQLYINKIEVF